jgi:pimeloyl-ACP methyl ester carboxylesterase
VTGDGVRLHVREWHGTGRGVLLAHGLASSSHIWDLVGPRLSAAGIRAVAYDHRGHGRSGKPSSGYGFDRTTADAAAVISTTGLRRPVVVGHSWGANVVLELAVRSPRSVSGAVLVDGGFLNLRDRFDWRTAKQVLAPPNLSGTPVHEFLETIRYFLHGQVEITPDVEGPLGCGSWTQQHQPRPSRTNHLHPASWAGCARPAGASASHARARRPRLRTRPTRPVRAGEAPHARTIGTMHQWVRGTRPAAPATPGARGRILRFAGGVALTPTRSRPAAVMNNMLVFLLPCWCSRPPACWARCSS